MSEPFRLAMWSGPRNISTAMMRSWGNRSDTLVWDEPLYAHYLHHTGIEHPGGSDVIAAGECDWQKVVTRLLGPLPKGKSLFFQKHMTHHLLAHIDRSWMCEMTHCFLIRDPRLVLASYIKTRPQATLADIGIAQQGELYDFLAATGAPPLVIDSRDVLQQPEAMLRAICAKLGIAFSAAMLRWPAGPAATDGVWAKHWYANVQNSTSFTPFIEREVAIPTGYAAMVEQALAVYQRLYTERLRPA